MSDSAAIATHLNRLQQRSLIAALAALPLLLMGAFFSPAQFFRSYLLAYLFWSSLALGSLGIFMLHNLTGGAWGLPIRRLLESASQTLPWLLLFFLPVMLGLKHLYAWSLPELVSGDAALEHKSGYLSPPFFLLRSLFYFGIWIVLAHFLAKWSRQQATAPDPAPAQRLQTLSGPGLLLYGVTITFASIDWVMSLEPHWYSTVYGLLFLVGQVLSALAFVIVMAQWLSRFDSLGSAVSVHHFHDWGNLTLAFVMIWAYLAFSQYLIIWSGNMAEEIPWYLHRMKGSWQWTAAFLLLFHFTIPFLLLLLRITKRTARILSSVALGILLVRFVDLFWMVVPSLEPGGFALHWMDLVAAVGVGGLWMVVFLRQLKHGSLPPLPRPQEAREAP